MDYAIIVNDNGELKTVSATEIAAHGASTGVDLEAVINTILDLRSANEALDRQLREGLDRLGKGGLRK